MVQSIVLPFGVLNNIPGVSGVDDVRFDVPQLDDIRDEIDETLPSLDEIEDAVDAVTVDVGDIFQQVDEAISGVQDDVSELLDIIDDLADTIVDEVQDEISGLTIDVDEIVSDITDQLDIDPEDLAIDADQIAQDIAEDVSEAIPAAVINVDEIVQGVVAALQDDLQTGGFDPQELADAILGERDQLDIPAPQINVSGVFGPLTEDIVRAFEEVIDQRVQAPDVDIPSVGDVRTAVGEEVEDVLEGLPGSDLLFNPDQFIDDQIDRLTDGLVSDEAQQNLQDALGGDD